MSTYIGAVPVEGFTYNYYEKRGCKKECYQNSLSVALHTIFLSSKRSKEYSFTEEVILVTKNKSNPDYSQDCNVSFLLDKGFTKGFSWTNPNSGNTLTLFLKDNLKTSLKEVKIKRFQADCCGRVSLTNSTETFKVASVLSQSIYTSKEELEIYVKNCKDFAHHYFIHRVSEEVGLIYYIKKEKYVE